MLQKYHKTTHVRYGGSYLHYTGPTYMPNQQINTAQTETHSKYCLVLYTNIFIHQVEIMKNSTCLSLFKVPNVCQRDDTSQQTVTGRIDNSFYSGAVNIGHLNLGNATQIVGLH